MARSESEHIDNIKGRKEITVKKKLIDKINSLGAESTTSPKELTYLSKSLEVLNKQIRDTTSYTSDESKVNSTDNRPIRYDQQQVPNNAMPNWNVGRNQARNSTPAQFGVYTSHYAWSCGITIYDEACEPQTHSRWSWCHHYGHGNGGQWGPWSTAQRSSCFDWNGNNCYFNTAGTVTSSHCYNNGCDSVGPLGHSNLVTGPGAPLAVRFWCNASNQASSIGPMHEYRNEQVETGNYEPTDKYTYLIYQNQTVRLRNRRILPGANADYSQKPTTNGNIASYGTLTHNFTRKELAVVNRNDTVQDHDAQTGYHFDTKIYKAVPDINLETNMATALNDSTAKTIRSRIEDGGHRGNLGETSIGLEYTMNDRSVYPRTLYQPDRAESYQGIKICMVDNGDIYWSVLHNSCHSLHKCTRYTYDGVTDDDYYDWGFVPVYSKVAAMRGLKGQDEWKNENVIGYDNRPEPVDTLYCDNIRGREEGGEHPNGTSAGCGHVNIMSRNHRNVILQTPYYYRGCGMASWIIDKRFSRWQTAWYVRTADYGCQWGPFGEEGFVASYSRDGNGIDCAYRLYIHRQDHNTGVWQRSEMSRTTAERVPTNTHYPTLIPIY
tara:strand:- start:7545 stop:9362 length:1818 start_codon:yes stop_codon:yes gene_type:complete